MTSGAPRAIAVLPARLASTRLPRKMLLRETGRCLFLHTAEAARSSGAFARVVVATDAAEVVEAAQEAGFEAVMTREDLQSGTDRVFAAWKELAAAGEKAGIVVNVQGDEPEIDRSDLARVLAPFADGSTEIATLAAPLESEEEWRNPAAVKVVCDARGGALYFSRAPIPARGHAARPTAPADIPGFRHIGVYAFTPSALARCASLPPGRLEQAESLEQLRWLESGERIRVVTASRAPAGIDTRADYDAFVSRWRATSKDRGGHRAGNVGEAARSA